MSPFPLRLVLWLLLAGVPFAKQSDTALRCEDHIAFDPAWTSVLVSSWTFRLATNSVAQQVYLARYTGHVYAPTDDLTSNIYRGLDFFHRADFNKGPNFIMYFQRAAKVYMFANVADEDFDDTKTANLPGWKPVGWAQRIDGESTITYGTKETLTRKMPMYAYVFSRDTNGKDFVDLPQARFVKKKVSGITVTGTYNLWIAEEDGSASPDPGKFKGLTIQPNKACPSQLHDAWRVPSDDPQDPLPGTTFTTWHPQWDPCFWCAYNHEHGANAKMIMGYTPKFTYTALKNNNQAESDRGFKGYLMQTGPYYVYYSLHIVQSSLRRVTTRFHTINLVVTNRKTGELLADLQHKADFGWAGVRLDSGGFRPINANEKAIQDAQNTNDSPRNFRSINIVDESNLNPEFEYRNPVLVGTYEVWVTLPMCASPKSPKSLLVATFRTPNSAFRALDAPNDLIPLGRREDNRFYQALGLNRNLKAKGLKIGAAHCPQTSSGPARGEVFYTNPTGTTVVNGPGPAAVRQFIKAGFEMTLNGRFEVADTWNGLHRNGERGFFVDHGYGIDPEFN